VTQQARKDPLAASGLAELALERTPAGSLVRRYLAGPLGTFSFHRPHVDSISPPRRKSHVARIAAIRPRGCPAPQAGGQLLAGTPSGSTTSV
jgi:hypothetical protein